MREFLLDLHARCHRSLQHYLDHCRDLEIDRELEGFGYPTIREQLHHCIGAERYWVSVVRGEMDASEDEADAQDLDGFHERVTAQTRAYLESETDFITPRPLVVWGGHERDLVPLRVILRTQTHLFHHMGQVAAMCRLLGKPIPEGWDFPLA